MNTKTTNSQQTKDELLLKEITDLNLTIQNNFLIENGFTKLKRNIKALQKTSFDKEKALAFLNDKKSKKKSGKHDSNELKNKKWQEKIGEKNLKVQNDFLISKGFTSIRKNFKKLEKFNGEKDLALEAMVKHDEKMKNKPSKEEKRKKIEEEIKSLGFTSQNEFLISKGYTKPKANLKVLKKVKGDLEKSLKTILEKYEKRELRRKLKKEMSPEEKQKKKLERETKLKLKSELLPFLLTEVKSNTKILYLDGNNMLFVDDWIRKLCLKHKGKEAENLISQLSQEFCKIFNVEKCILVFDRTNNVYEVNSNSLKFTVCSASPNFKTSDDALVEWTDGLSAKDNVLFITSDVGLQVRLKEKGVKMIMKTGKWFKILKEKLGEEKYNLVINKDTNVEMNEIKMKEIQI